MIQKEHDIIKIGGGTVCWTYDTLCDQNQSPCIMSKLKETNAMTFSKKHTFQKSYVPIMKALASATMPIVVYLENKYLFLKADIFLTIPREKTNK